ncbi:hypothetical protein C5613_43180 [Rhodococcus opacus]|uniref:Uncharacterized protein n=1 Tax=Rhodococcus opacus TaxID=37919 RepID=A0A2S8IAK2_RHOOP|nr:hypothetical protein C5613_43180 [Rhodococcus opacus]
MQQQRQHDRQRDQRQDHRAETIVLDQILVGWNSGAQSRAATRPTASTAGQPVPSHQPPNRGSHQRHRTA